MIEFFSNFCCFISDFFVRRTRLQEGKSLLIVRTDAIGDYILFRNFLASIRYSQRFITHKITLVGNQAWRDLAEALDGEYVDRFIWIDTESFKRDYKYRRDKMLEICVQGYSETVNPIYSRDFLVSDSIARITKAPIRIGSAGDLSNISLLAKWISDRFYTELIPTTNNVIFEYFRNKLFFEEVLDDGIRLPNKPSIDKQHLKFGETLSVPYVVIFIGAGSSVRRWSIASYADIAKSLNDRFGLQIVLCGGPMDKEMGNEFGRLYGRTYIDCVGTRSLYECLAVLQSAQALISNDTSAAHMSAALPLTRTLVISNGNHYGRFSPYPKELGINYQLVCHPNLENGRSKFMKLMNMERAESKLDIDEVEVRAVLNELDLMFSQTNI